MQIGIVGLGLIGGSLGLDLRETGHRVYGLSRSSQSCELAQAMGAVDEAATVPEILKNLDMVVLCTPIGSMVKVFHHIQPYLASETVVTDVGSVKASVVNSLEPLWPNFLGAHPMAGKAEAGIQAAQRHLFLNRPFVVTPTPRTDPVAQARVQDLVAAVGGTLHFADPQSHDQAVALISHLPIFVSAGLLTGCLQTEDSAVLTLAKSLASTGFQDTSRVGGGSPELGVMVAQYNQQALLQSLDQFEAAITQLRRHIEAANWEAIEQILTTTQQMRPEFLRA